jgi:hypothetical protein
MNITELYNLTLVHEALKAGERVRTSDINFVYKTIPCAPAMKAKEGKIKYINMYFDTISTETIQRYLIDQQLKPIDNGTESNG